MGSEIPWWFRRSVGVDASLHSIAHHRAATRPFRASGRDRSRPCRDQRPCALDHSARFAPVAGEPGDVAKEDEIIALRVGSCFAFSSRCPSSATRFREPDTIGDAVLILAGPGGIAAVGLRDLELRLAIFAERVVGLGHRKKVRLWRGVNAARLLEAPAREAELLARNGSTQLARRATLRVIVARPPEESSSSALSASSSPQLLRPSQLWC